MACRNIRRQSGRESQGLVRSVSALSAVVTVTAVLLKVSPVYQARKEEHREKEKDCREPPAAVSLDAAGRWGRV